MLRIRSCVGMIAAALVIAANAGAQEKLSTHWEELTGPDFVRAIH